jgi:hypothetical protein
MATCNIHLTGMFVTHGKMQHISDKMLDTHGKM